VDESAVQRAFGGFDICEYIQAYRDEGLVVLDAGHGPTRTLEFASASSSGQVERSELPSPGGSWKQELTLAAGDTASIRTSQPWEAGSGGKATVGQTYKIEKQGLTRLKQDGGDRHLNRVALAMEAAFGFDYGEGIKSQKILPGQALGPGARWRSSARHQHGGTVTHFELLFAEPGQPARVRFERYVCEQNVARSVPISPELSEEGQTHCSDGKQPDCERARPTVNRRIELGLMDFRPGAPLPDVTTRSMEHSRWRDCCTGTQHRITARQVELRWGEAATVR
jgi:hypothetical protein